MAQVFQCWGETVVIDPVLGLVTNLGELHDITAHANQLEFIVKLITLYIDPKTPINVPATDIFLAMSCICL